MIGETPQSEPAQPAYDLSDWLTLVAAIGGFTLPWVYAFMHPSVEAFGICVTATVTGGSIYHAIRVHDDKKPDAKE